MRKCTRCQLEKNVSEFGTKKRKNRGGEAKSYLSIYCRECEKIIAKQYRVAHPEKIKEYNGREDVKIKKLRWEEQNNPYEDRKPYYQQRYQDQKESGEIQKIWETSLFKEGKRKYKNKRRKEDPIFRVRENISNAIWKALKKGKSNKAGQSILKYLGYTIDDLVKHLESQFDSIITWGNYGNYWHIDHIIPQSDLPFSSMKENNFKICWALNNLRPYPAKQNIIDGASRIRHKK
jgi:hypothetical protein